MDIGLKPIMDSEESKRIVIFEVAINNIIDKIVAKYRKKRGNKV